MKIDPLHGGVETIKKSQTAIATRRERFLLSFYMKTPKIEKPDLVLRHKVL